MGHFTSNWNQNRYGRGEWTDEVGFDYPAKEVWNSSKTTKSQV